MSTYSTLQQEVLDIGFSDARYRPFVKTVLNRAVRDIVRRADIRVDESSQTYTTSAGTNTAALPTNYCRLIDLSNTTDTRLLKPIELRDFDESIVTQAKPTSYVVIGQNLTFYPTPDAAYSLLLRYWSFPADMSADTDVFPLSEDFEDLVVNYSAAKCYMREADYTASQAHMTAYETDLMRRRGEEQHDTADGARRVPGTWNTDNRRRVGVWY